MKALRLANFKPTMVGMFNLVGAAVIIYLVVILGQTVMSNYKLNKEITDLRVQIMLLQDQKDELAYNIQYYKTDSFQQREARAKLGLQLPDENVVVLPKSTPAAAPAAAAEATSAKKKSNFAQWLDFLAGNS